MLRSLGRREVVRREGEFEVFDVADIQVFIACTHFVACKLFKALTVHMSWTQSLEMNSSW